MSLCLRRNVWQDSEQVDAQEETVYIRIPRIQLGYGLEQVATDEIQDRRGDRRQRPGVPASRDVLMKLGNVLPVMLDRRIEQIHGIQVPRSRHDQILEGQVAVAQRGNESPDCSGRPEGSLERLNQIVRQRPC